MIPKYKAIREVLLGRITSGTWAPGDAIPHEAALAEEFGVTRPTISRALRDLVERGLVERRRRVGSRVALRQTPVVMLRVPILRDEIEERGGIYSHLVLSQRMAVPPTAVRAIFDLPSRGQALQLCILHFDSGQPHQIEDRWINAGMLPEAATQDFTAMSPNEWLVREVPYSRAEQILEAAAATPAEAELLQITPASPVFGVERTTWNEADAITRVRLVHPGERYRIVTRTDR